MKGLKGNVRGKCPGEFRGNVRIPSVHVFATVSVYVAVYEHACASVSLYVSLLEAVYMYVFIMCMCVPMYAVVTLSASVPTSFIIPVFVSVHAVVLNVTVFMSAFVSVLNQRKFICSLHCL